MAMESAMKKVAESHVLTVATRACMILSTFVATFYVKTISELQADVGKAKTDIALIQQGRMDAAKTIVQRLDTLENNDRTNRNNDVTVSNKLTEISTILTERFKAIEDKLNALERRRADLKPCDGILLYPEGCYPSSK